jgi:acyl-CoA thioesterase
MTDDAASLAERILADVMARDPASARGLGITVEWARPGHVRLACVVRPEMVHSQGVCHGAYLFGLADTACAFAAMARNEYVLTQTAHVTFLSPAREGERLVAEAVEVARTRRGGTYDVRVSGPDGRLVLLLRGLCRTTGRAILPAAGAEG